MIRPRFLSALRSKKLVSAGRSPVWSLTALEPRMMLAGDAGVEVAGATANGATNVTQDVTQDQCQIDTECEVAVVDSSLQHAEELADLVREGVEVIAIEFRDNPIEQLQLALQGRRNIRSLHLISHGHAGAIQLGDVTVDTRMLQQQASSLEGIATMFAPGADILLYGCQSGAGEAGEAFLSTLAELTGADVAGSKNITGASHRGGDWILEAHIGPIESSLLASLERLNRVDMVLPITIRAAGSSGEEQMQLAINGTVVQTWNNIGGDAGTGQYQTYTYNGGETATPDDVRILFTNDLYQPDQNIDRNLRIDSVTVNGVTIETEDPSVFSTGTWLPVDGIQPGYRQSEWLHGNGYLQYADLPSTGSTISVFAAGNENTEQMQLWIGGGLVQTWNDIGGDAYGRQFVQYDFTASTSASIEDIQIHFTNDLYESNGTVDRNLRIDRVVLDGITYQTEAADVYSTGTWQNGSITPGFKQDEMLHANGYFQYGAGGVSDPGVISLETSNISVDEDQGTVSLNVIRTGGSDGTVTVDYETFAGTATAGNDYTTQVGTLTFADGVTSQAIVVPILNDALVESTESFSVAIDNVTGGASLLVPRTATVTIFDDEVALPDYANFDSVAGLDLNGDARRNGSVLELTTANNNRAGSAFYSNAISLQDNASFRSAFSFQITGGGGTGGADGLTFTIQNDASGAAAIGGTGGQLGYSGIANSVAVEFDTYRNGNLEVNDNHVSIISGGVLNDLRTAIPDFDLNNGTRYYAWVDYNGVSDVLAVYLSTTATKPGVALLKTTVDLQDVVGDSGFVGFTAGTGGLVNSHQIYNWTLDQQIPPFDPPTQEGDTVVGTAVASGLNRPTAIDWLPDGRMLISEQGGIVWSNFDGSTSSTPFIDISQMVNGTRDRGLLDIAVHPDFYNNPYVYLLFTYDPPEVYNQASGTLAGPDGNGNRAGRLIRVTADASNGYQTAVAGSEVILLGANSTWENFNGFANSTFDFDEPPAGELPDGTYLQDFINSDSESHSIGALAFGIDGNLFVSIGDGASYNRVDVRADRVQDIDSLSGKVLRIDPITGQGLADNPFYNDDPDANRSKVYQLGLRNPFRMSVDPVTGQLFIGDVGWTKWEEINSAGPGANFGWPFYEGGSGTNLVNDRYADTPEGQAFFAQSVLVEPSIYALNHQADGINAIVVGDVYRGTLYGSEYQGDIFFNDLGQGIVRHASIDALGQVSDVTTFTTGAGIVVAISQGPDGALYYVDLNDNLVGRWEVV